TIAKIESQFANVVEHGLMHLGPVRLAPETEQNPAGGSGYFQVDTQPTSATPRIWFTQPGLFFGALPLSAIEAPLGLQLYVIPSVIISIGSWVVVIAGIIISSFFIPNMMRKGTVDLLLVKPIHRWALLSYKYVGGLTFIFINNVYAIVGIWLALGLRSGV